MDAGDPQPADLKGDEEADTTPDARLRDATTKRLLVATVLLAAAVAVVIWTRLDDIRDDVLEQAAGNGITAQLAGLVVGADDAVIAQVQLAHSRLNEAAWGPGGSEARDSACEELTRAVELAPGLEYSDTEVMEISAVRDACADEAVRTVVAHNAAEGLEQYLTTGQGRE